MKKILFLFYFNIQLIFCQSTFNKVEYRYKINNNFISGETIKKEKDAGLKENMNLFNTSLKNYQNKISFNLIFNKVESIFSMNKILDFDKELVLAIALTKSKDLIYTNLKEKIILKKVNSLGHNFNIKTDLNSRNWELTQETKTIGEYLCFKAITNSIYKKNINIIAWYCPNLSFSHGPKGYAGLPGLILELEDKVIGITYYAKEIKLNLKEKISLKFKNKEIFFSQKEFDSIININTKKRFRKPK